MNIIKIANSGTQRGIRLDDVQVAQVLAELDRVLPNAEPVDALLDRVAPDFEMVVAPDGEPAKRYHVYGRSVLVDESTSTMTQFYMGLLLMEWLYR